MTVSKKNKIFLFVFGVLALLGFGLYRAFQIAPPIVTLDRTLYALNPSGPPNGLDALIARVLGGCILYNGNIAPTSMPLSLNSNRVNFIHCNSPLSGAFQLMAGIDNPDFYIFRSPTNGITLELISGHLSLSSNSFKIRILLNGISAEIESKEPVVLHIGKNDKSGFYNISANSGAISISKIRFAEDRSSIMALEFEAGKTGKVIFENGHKSPVEGKSVLLLPSGFYD